MTRRRSMASKFKLFDSGDEDSDPENCKLSINKEYAEKYKAWKEKEELQKLKEKYGDASDYSSTSEDEEEVNWNAEFDKEWLRVYSAVKFKDRNIYDKDIQFVRVSDEGEQEDKEGEEEEDSDSDTDSSESEESEKEKTSRKKKKTDDAPLTIRDHERRMITDRNGLVSESEDEEEMDAHTLGPSYHEEQEAIRKSITKAVADMSSEDEDEDILIKRIKSEKEKKKEEEEYLQFLKGDKEADDMKTRDKRIAKDLAPLRNLFSQPDDNAEASQVVWNTLICRGALKEKPDEEDEDLIEEETELIKMEDDEEEFEHVYNFRFEEPDKNFVKQYKRNPEDSVRQEVNKRAQKRKEVQERKKTAMDERREEIRRLKKLKQKELENRLQLLTKEWPSGVNFAPEDLKGEFDPKAYDKMMQEKFEKMNEVDDDDDDEEKPDIGDLDDVLSIGSHENCYEEADVSMADSAQEEEEGQEGTSATGEQHAHQAQGPKLNAGYDDESWIPDMSQMSRKARRKRKSKFQQVVQEKADKARFDEGHSRYKDYGDYIQDHYKLDYKEYGFSYHNVVANDYGLQEAEMLWLPARELNAWVSLKTVIEPKSESEEMYEKRKYQSAKMQRKMVNIMPSLKKIDDDASNFESLQPSVMRQQKMAQQDDDDDDDMSEASESHMPTGEDLGTRLLTDSQPSQKKKKKKALGESAEQYSPLQTDSQLSPKKKKKRKALETAEQDSPPQKKKKKSKAVADQALSQDLETDETVHPGVSGAEGKKKKKLGIKERKTGEDYSLQEKTEIKETESELHSDIKTKKKKKKKGGQENQKTDVVEEKKIVTEALETDTKVSSKDSTEQDTSEKKKKKKSKLKGEEQQTTGKKSRKTKFKGKKKQKKGKDGVKGYVAKDKITESRLAAFGIDPRKFKYTKDRMTPLQPDQE